MEVLFSNGASEILTLLISLGFGTLMGLRRELDAQGQSEENKSFMGIRTSVIFTLLGTISTLFPALPSLPIFVFSGILLLVLLAYTNGAFRKDKIGLTSELSALTMFFVGLFVGYDRYLLAIFLTILLMVIDEFRLELHKFISTLSITETRGVLQLLIFSGLVLPFLPRVAIDPLGILIPFNIWLLVIFISGIRFVGYFLMKVFGERSGTFLTAILGALATSTAVTFSLAAQSKNKRISQNILAAGILVAIAVMQIRVIFEILVVGTMDMKTTSFLLIPLAMAVTALVFSIISLKTSDGEGKAEAKVEAESPFEILPAIKFGGLFVLILIFIALGKKFLGNSGVFFVSGLSGLADIDAVVLSSLEAVRGGGLSVPTAQTSIFIGLIANTLVKLGYIWILGSRDLLKKLIPGVVAVSAAGAFVWFFI